MFWPRCIKLGGETDAAIGEFGETELVYVTESNGGSYMLRTFLKPSLKIPSICCEFECYNKKLYLNNSISSFS